MPIILILFNYCRTCQPVSCSLIGAYSHAGIWNDIRVHDYTVFGQTAGALDKTVVCSAYKLERNFAALPWTFIRVVSPSLIFMVCYYMVFWFLSQDRPLRMRYPLLWCCGLVITALALSIFIPVVNNDLYIVFLDVGQGDCVYIRTPDEKHILIDGGGKYPSSYDGTFDVGEDVVVPFLLKNGVWHLDLVVMSHAHDDHIEGLVSVLNNIRVRAFMEYPPGEDNENYAKLKELVAKNGIRNIHAHEGFHIELVKMYGWTSYIRQRNQRRYKPCLAGG